MSKTLPQKLLLIKVSFLYFIVLISNWIAIAPKQKFKKSSRRTGQQVIYRDLRVSEYLWPRHVIKVTEGCEGSLHSKHNSLVYKLDSAFLHHAVSMILLYDYVNNGDWALLSYPKNCCRHAFSQIKHQQQSLTNATCQGAEKSPTADSSAHPLLLARICFIAS